MPLQTPRQVFSKRTENMPVTDTFKIDNSTILYSATAKGGSTVINRAVKISTDDTVALCAAGDAIQGVLRQVEPDGACTVQLFGYATLPTGNGATLTIGAKAQGAADAGSVVGAVNAIAETVSASPTQAEVQNVLRAGKSRATIVNNDDTANVVVLLG